MHMYQAYIIVEYKIMYVQRLVYKQCWQSVDEICFVSLSRNATCVFVLSFFFFHMSLCHTHVFLFCFFNLAHAAG